MRATLSSVLLLTVSFISYGADDSTLESSEAIDMTISTNQTKKPSSQEQRSLSFEICAILYRVEQQVEISLYNIGNATITITNAYGNIEDSVTLSTDTPNFTILNILSGSGSYYLRVSSTVIYAEGYFSL